MLTQETMQSLALLAFAGTLVWLLVWGWFVVLAVRLFLATDAD